MFKQQSIAIAGFGVEGRSTVAWLQRRGVSSDQITIYDQREVEAPNGIRSVVVGEFSEIPEGHDSIVRTASLRPDALPDHTDVTSATRIFFDHCPAPIIGVTGTKGKGTTTSLIHHILTNAGKTAHLVGNIGTACLDVLDDIKPDDLVCFELSSFQLWDLKQSPQTAVVLMIEPDHLDVHRDMDEYVQAKSNIARHQTADDWLVYHPSNVQTASIAELSPAIIKMPYLSDPAANVVDGQLVIAGQQICATSEFGLIGKHNWENICAAVTAAWRYTQSDFRATTELPPSEAGRYLGGSGADSSVSFASDQVEYSDTLPDSSRGEPVNLTPAQKPGEFIQAIKQAVTQFTGLSHRLQLIRELNGIKYYDDSFSAAPSAAVVASRSIKGPFVQIIGGKDRGLDYGVFKDLNHDDGNHYVLFGENRQKIADEMSNVGFNQYTVVDGDLETAFNQAKGQASEGWSVILSPGSPSFDMYENYKQRAADYERLVNGL